MDVLLIPAHTAQVHKQHIPSSIRPNKTERHPAHTAATRYRQAHLSSSPEPTDCSILHGSSAAAKPAAKPHPEEGTRTRTHHPTVPLSSPSIPETP